MGNFLPVLLYWLRWVYTNDMDRAIHVYRQFRERLIVAYR